MVHRHLPAFLRTTLLTAAFVAGPGADCLGDDPPEPKPCTARCDVEDACGLRSEDDCLKTSCSDDGEPLDQGADDCLAAAGDASDCLLAAACACDGGCGKIDECAEAEPNPECVSACDTLVEQAPEATYQENRCRIEKDCEDLATCASSG